MEHAISCGLFAARLLAALCFASCAAKAGETPRAEMFGGVAWEGRSASTHVGGGWAFGKKLHDPGPRVRVKAGYGFYRYESALPPIGDADFLGQHSFVEALAGWQFRRGPATIKLFGGIADQAHTISPGDPRNKVNGNETGAAAALEIWMNVGSSAWAQFDAQATTAFETYNLHGRFGYRVRPRLGLGLEAGVLGNLEYDAVRAGGFLRTWLFGTELTLSGGATGSYPLGDPAGYAALSFYRAF